MEKMGLNPASQPTPDISKCFPISRFAVFPTTWDFREHHRCWFSWCLVWPFITPCAPKSRCDPSEIPRALANYLRNRQVPSLFAPQMLLKLLLERTSQWRSMKDVASLANTRNCCPALNCAQLNWLSARKGFGWFWVDTDTLRVLGRPWSGVVEWFSCFATNGNTPSAKRLHFCGLDPTLALD